MQRLVARLHRTALIVCALACAMFALSAPAHATATPTGLTVAVADGQLLLSWNAGAAGSTYNLYRSTLGGGYAKITATALTTTTYTDPGLTDGQTYFYTVTAIVSGVESAQSAPVAGTPNVHINSGGPGLSSAGTNATPYVWREDDAAHQVATGGTVLSTGSAITSVPTGVPAALFQTDRISTDTVAGHGFSYAVPVADGTYILNLYFAEIGGATTGQRKFTVTANGAAFLTNFDVYATAGGADIAVQEHTTVTVTNGTLTVAVTNVTGAATVAGIALTTPSPFVSNPPPGWASDAVPTETMGGGGSGPSSAISVEIPTGTPILDGGADLSCYNPHGPSVSYERLFRGNLNKPGQVYSAGLSPGWRDNYDMQIVQSNGTTFSVNWITGGSDTWAGTNGSSVFTPGSALPYQLTGTPGTGTNVWSALTIIFKDHTQLTFMPDPSNATLFRLSAITNIAGNSVTISRSPTTHALTSIANDASLTLLTFVYSGSQLSTVTDAYGRKVTYGFGSFNGSNLLAHVSQIGTTTDRWTYGYIAVPSQAYPYLDTVTCPDPSTPGGTATATIAPDAYGRAQQVLDGIKTNGSPTPNATSFGYGSGSATIAKLPPGSSTPVFSYTQLFDMVATSPDTLGQDKGFLDANSHQESVGYSGAPGPYLPTKVVTRDGEQYPVAYASTSPSNNYDYDDVSETADPWGVTTTYNYDFTNFALGEVTSITENSTNGGTSSALTPTKISWWHATSPSQDAIKGLPHVVYTPAPTVQNGTQPTIDTTYLYTPLGDVLSVTTPGPNSTVGTETTYTTTTYNYGSTPQKGEPLTVTVSGLSSDGSTTTQAETYTYYGVGSPNAGMPASAEDASGNTTGYAYNAANQLTQMTYPPSVSGGGSASVVTAYQYPGGPLSSETLYDESGHAFEQVTYTYDAEGNVASERGSTYPVDYTYDALFRPLTMTEYTAYPNGAETTAYYYNPAGDLSDVYYPGSPSLTSAFDHWSYTYDPDDNLATKTDGDGSVTTYTLDPTVHALVDSISYGVEMGVTDPSLTTGTVGFTYDAFERRMSMSDETGSKSYSWSDIDLPVSVTTDFLNGPQNLAIGYSYNPDGSRNAMTVPLAPISGASYSYAYDGLSRMKTATAPFYDDIFYNHATPLSATYGYQANGWLTSMSQGTNGDVESSAYTYSGRGFLTNLTNRNNGHTVSAFDTTGAGGSLGYDAAGNRLGYVETLPSVVSGMSGTTRTVSYGYDMLGRNQLTGETSMIGTTYGSILNANYSYAYAYDDAGNPTTWKSAMGEFGFDTDNQVTSAMSLMSPVYDGSGNPTTFSTYATSQAGPSDPTNVNLSGAGATFDSEDRLVGLSSSSPAVAFSALYDGDGLRSQKTVGSKTTYYLYDGGTLLEEMTASGATPTLTEMYLSGADGVRARWDPSNFETDFYAYDPEGSLVQFQPSEDANPTQRTLVYDGWGDLTGDILYVQGTEQAPFGARASGVGTGTTRTRRRASINLGQGTTMRARAASSPETPSGTGGRRTQASAIAGAWCDTRRRSLPRRLYTDLPRPHGSKRPACTMPAPGAGSPPSGRAPRARLP